MRGLLTELKEHGHYILTVPDDPFFNEHWRGKRMTPHEALVWLDRADNMELGTMLFAEKASAEDMTAKIPYFGDPEWLRMAVAFSVVTLRP